MPRKGVGESISLKRAWRRLGAGSERLIALALVGSILRSLVVIPVAFVLRRLLDQALPDKDTGALLRGAVTLLALFAAAAVVNLVTRRAVLKLTQGALERVRLQLLDKLYALPRTYFNTVEDAQLQSLVLQDTGRLEAVLASTVSTLLPAVVVGAAVSVVAATMQPTLFGLVVITLPVTIVASRIVIRRVHRLSKRWQTTADDYSADVARAAGDDPHQGRRRSAGSRSRARPAPSAASGMMRSPSRTSRRSPRCHRPERSGRQRSRPDRGGHRGLPGPTHRRHPAVVLRRRPRPDPAGRNRPGRAPLLAAAAASFERIEGLLDAAHAPPYTGTIEARAGGGADARGRQLWLRQRSAAARGEPDRARGRAPGAARAQRVRQEHPRHAGARVVPTGQRPAAARRRALRRPRPP